jgi:hypothetical protein
MIKQYINKNDVITIIFFHILFYHYDEPRYDKL